MRFEVADCLLDHHWLSGFEMPKEQYMCQLCANHGVFNQPKKGHKQKCPHRNCICSLCALNTKRRALDQIERQLRNASNEMRGDTLVSANSDDLTLSAVPVKLPPTLSPQSYSPQEPSSSSSSCSVALPATASRREIHGLLQDEMRVGSNGFAYALPDPSWTTSTASSRNPSRTLKAALTNIQRNRSIFHSAEQLAGTS
ncbi:DM domain-containing protein [Trichostrongylus colubriformis]|uniref:DM domain-containing protein n=1 Tax=Trichostrongylus colubriformis TaxID=6319 RepID=A0AAN8J1W0_TRICO